jgi:hypothetical protein
MPPPFTAHPRGMTMTKQHRFKEEIGWLKALCGLLVAACMSLMVWLVQNYGATSRVAVVAALLCLLGLVAGIGGIVLRLYRCFKILESL